MTSRPECAAIVPITSRANLFCSSVVKSDRTNMAVPWKRKKKVGWGQQTGWIAADRSITALRSGRSVRENEMVQWDNMVRPDIARV